MKKILRMVTRALVVAFVLQVLNLAGSVETFASGNNAVTWQYTAKLIDVMMRVRVTAALYIFYAVLIALLLIFINKRFKRLAEVA